MDGTDDVERVVQRRTPTADRRTQSRSNPLDIGKPLAYVRSSKAGAAAGRAS